MLIIYFKHINKSLVFGVLIVLLASCEKTWYDEFVIVNSTNHQVLIDAYDTDIESELIHESINIAPKGNYSIFKGNGFHGDIPGIFKDDEIDSVRIVFDNNKVIIQSCDYPSGVACEFSRNIMNFNNKEDYIVTKRGKSQGIQQYRYTYTITEEDYSNAVPINE
jgi:hypothetical protein